MRTTRENRIKVWALVGVALLFSILGSALNLYDKFWWFDEVLHGYAMFAYTLVVALFAYGVVLGGAREHRLLFVLAVGGVGLAMGAVWEILEWVYDQIVRPNAILAKTDTILDLVVDSIGALAAGYVCSRILKV